MEQASKKAQGKSLFWGILGGTLLLSIYFIIVSLANSFSHALQEFTQLWYWIGALSAGFGIQVGLYAHVRQAVRLRKQTAATSSVAASGGVSAVSMVACCAHHVADLLPILGISAAAAFLSTYQLEFILLGVASNIIGITYMLRIISKHHLYFGANKWLAKLALFNYKRLFQVEIPIVLILLLFSIISGQATPDPEQSNHTVDQSQQAVLPDPIELEEQQVQQNGVDVLVSGIYELAKSSLSFRMRFATHSGSLDFRVDEISTLTINGQEFEHSISWSGSPPGGHHLAGELRYSHLPEEVHSILLTLSNEERLGIRTFSWAVSEEN